MKYIRYFAATDQSGRPKISLLPVLSQIKSAASFEGNCSGKKIFFFIPSIDRVCGSDAQEKKSDFLHGSVRRYKTLRSSTNCGCGHLMTHFVGIAITQQFIVVAFT